MQAPAAVQVLLAQTAILLYLTSFSPLGKLAGRAIYFDCVNSFLLDLHLIF